MPIRIIDHAGRYLPRELAVLSASAITMLLAACGSNSTTVNGAPSPTASTSAPAQPSSPAPVATSQVPVPAESNPPGDIPDTTVYVAYHSAVAHAVVKVPEGWARQDSANGSTFTSNLNSISIASAPMTTAPTVRSARAVTVPALKHSTLAFRLVSVQAVTLQGGPAIEIIYKVNSPPNAVTGRQYRLVIERFEFYKNGHGAVLSLSSAVGSDNVDPWRIVSESLRWA